MQNLGNAVMSSWTLRPELNVFFLLMAGVYFTGWRRGRRLFRRNEDGVLLASFPGGLLVLFLALESPLDALDQLFLSAHMTQHLLLMMVAPALLLYSKPSIPLLRGLPRVFMKEGLGPFLAWPELQRFLAWLSSPPVAWLFFAVSTIGWHLPRFYELALRSPSWHNLQHASFFWTGILFWWPVLNPPGTHSWPRWSLIPYLLLADLVNTALSAFLIFSDRVLYPAYESVRLSGFSAHTDQALAGAVMWVPGSIFYLLPATVIAARQFGGVRRQLPPARRPAPALVQLTASRPAILRWRVPLLRRIAQGIMLVLAIAVMWDGFTGTQVAPLNLAGVLPWVYWRALSVLALLFVGNLFCMVCPFTFVRDMARRFTPPGAQWPRQLRSKWLPFTLILVYLWAYEACSLWNKPRSTAFLIAAYFAAALLIDSFFRGASFCKYVCPIGQFHFVSSLVSPGEIRIKDEGACKSCRTHDCIKGNDHARGCELGLFQPKKIGNMDCTFCLDCVQACPQDNVTFAMSAPAKTLFSDPFRSSVGKLSQRADVAALAMLIVFGGFVNAALMTSPVLQSSWAANAMWPVMVLLPAASVFSVTRRSILALIPLGLAMWTAHLTFHLAASFNVASVHGLQLLILDSGLLMTLYTLWRMTGALAALLPWVLLSCAMYALGVWILLQPMQMRGIMQ
jgi:cytochrome c oxidase assembly factor CtaG/ferredoxin